MRSAGSKPRESQPNALPGAADADAEDVKTPGPVARFWRSRTFARIRHTLGWLRRITIMTTRAHAKLIQLSGGRIRRSFLFTGGMPILVLTTTGRKSGEPRSTPVGFLPFGDDFAIIASNAGNDHTPAWWLNLQANPMAEVFVDRRRRAVRARRATEAEDESLWSTFSKLNPGFGEYRNLTERRIPVVVLESVDS